MERPAAPVGPVHHGCHGKSMCLKCLHFSNIINSLGRHRVHSFIRHNPTLFARLRRRGAHGAHTKVATFAKLPSGSWRVQIRHKGRYVSETFLRREDARRWALTPKCQVDRGETPTAHALRSIKTFGELVDLHIDDMKRRQGARPLQGCDARHAEAELGEMQARSLDRERLIRFGRERADQGAAQSPWAWTSARSGWFSPMLLPSTVSGSRRKCRSCAHRAEAPWTGR